MTDTRELIAQLRALGIPDWATARHLMEQAADAIEALEAEVERSHLRSSSKEASMIKLAEPDTHCYDDDTGKDVWSHSPDQLKQAVRDALTLAEKTCHDQTSSRWVSIEAAAECADAIRALIKEIPE